MRYPSMVRPNFLYRGPLESFKQTASVKDIDANIQDLYDVLTQNDLDLKSLASDMATEYNSTIPDTLQVQENQVKSVEGGEL